MNNIFLIKKFKCLQYLNSKSSDKWQADTHEIISFNEFVEIDTEQLEWNNQVRSKITMIFNSNDVILILWVAIPQMQDDV